MGSGFGTAKGKKEGPGTTISSFSAKATFGPVLTGKSTRRGSPTIRPGKKRRLKTGSPLLRSLWDLNNRAFSRYGFGRVELLPIRSSSEAVAKYVGKYISKQIGQRPEEDKGVRLTGHSAGFIASKPNFSWNSPGAKKWRQNLALFAQFACGCNDHDDFLQKAPRRWAYTFKDDIMTYDRHYNEKFPEDAPF